MVTAKELKAECLRRRYLDLLDQPNVFPSVKNWTYIIAEAMAGLGPALYRKYLVALMMDESLRSEYHLAAIRHFPEYLKIVDREHALETVYSDYSTNPDAFIALVRDCDLFDAGRIAEIINSGTVDDLHIGVSLLEAMQPTYDDADLATMSTLLERLRNLPALGRVEEHRGLLGVTRKYVCPRRHINDAGYLYCTDASCRLDIRGLSEEDEQRVDRYAQLVETLTDMLINTK